MESARGPSSIAVLRMSALGDVVMTLPLLRTLQKAFPQAKLHWIVSRPFDTIVQGISGGPLASLLGVRRRSNTGYIVVGANAVGRALARALGDAGEEAVLIDNNAVVHLIAETLPYENPSTCGAVHAYGYYELGNATGGQVGSICQSNLGPTIDTIIDSIVGEASPITLSTVPISASVSVARDNDFVVRSRMTGWDYRAGSNAIVFFNMPFDPANPSDIVVSYRRWADQDPLE